jgi:TBC1 domain family member 8/9
MEEQAEGSYFRLLPRPGQSVPFSGEIDKDLHRTFMGNRFMEDVHRQRLRNILVAYAVRNPEVGYCQSMNFVCALLLLYLDEERAFWTLAAMVEDMILNYYGASLEGSMVPPPPPPRSPPRAARPTLVP